MPEYISREAAKDEMCERCSNVLMCTRSDNDCPIKRGLNSIPAADVVEVRHGMWHRFSKGSGSYNGVIILSDAFQCTVCKESFWNKSNYCPSCGAVMDGGQDE